MVNVFLISPFRLIRASAKISTGNGADNVVLRKESSLIGIVGGGISGLFLGHELVRRGMDVVIWEATDRLGGVVLSDYHSGLVLEKGPQRMRMTPQVKRLIEELGLQQQVVMASNHLDLFVYSRGRLRKAPLNPKQFFMSDLLPFSSKLRFLGEILTAGVRRDETVGGFLRRKFGSAAYSSFLGPLYGGLYGSDPDRMLVKSSLAQRMNEAGIGRSLVWGLWRLAGKGREAAPCSFDRGLGRLPNALGRRLEEHVRLESAVESVYRSELGWRGGVEGGTEVQVDALVLACPAEKAASLIREECPQTAQLWQQMNYNELAICHMKSDANLEGLGYQVGFGERLETRGVTFNHSLFGREGLYTAFLGGMKNPDLLGMPDEVIASIATSEFHQVTGHEATSIDISRTRIPAWDFSWKGYTDVQLPKGIFVCSNFSGRPGIQGRIQEAQFLSKKLRDYLLRLR